MTWDNLHPIILSLSADTDNAQTLLDITHISDASESPRELIMFATEALVEESHECSLNGSLRIAALVNLICSVLKRIKTKKYSAFLESVCSSLFPKFQSLKFLLAKADDLNDSTKHVVYYLVDSFVNLIDLCAWIANNLLGTEEESIVFTSVSQNISSCIWDSLYSAFPSSVFPWQEQDQSLPSCGILLDLCIKINNACSKAFDFFTIDPQCPLVSLPSTLKFLIMSLDRNDAEYIEWIPAVTQTEYLFRFLAKGISTNFLEFSNKTCLNSALATLQHIFMTKKFIKLHKADLSESSSILDLIKSLLQVLATNPNQKERDFVLSFFKNIFELFQESAARNEVLQIVMTHKAVNVRSFGIYLYKNELVEARKSESSITASAGIIESRVSKLLFSLSSQVYTSPSFTEHFLENDDVFFELCPLIAQALTFLGYLKQYSRHNGGEDEDHYFRSISIDFVAPIRQRTKIMLYSREEALKVIAGDNAQCNQEISTLSLLMFQMEQF
ncbi:UNVERIFIED_CONTAM: hypothetical protein HDU68_001010 [Siphonaria sp. JEL0065]|nr:hypothetical protein HDU68_001010 [Siphonaria sp. JEL0065]